MSECFGVIGGDRRQTELARLLAADGHEVRTYGVEDAAGSVTLEQAAASEIVLLPLPLCREEGLLNCREEKLPTRELFQRLRPEQRVLAGQVRPAQRQEAAACGVTLEDYFLQEELTVTNAAITAECAIQVAMEHLDRTLLGSRCLVVGFGRIGKLLSTRLHALGAQVTATARRPAELAWIRAYGWQALETTRLDGQLSGFDVVFNTVPALILDAPLLAQLPRECLCVDLAQGIDLPAAEHIGLSAVWARSLPGRMAPHTAAEALRDAIYRLLDTEPKP